MKKYKNKDWLYQKYVKEGLSTHEIAKVCKANSQTIVNWLRKFNIPVRTLSEASKLWHKNHLGAFKGRDNPHWKNGRKVDTKGYILIHTPDHPYANNSGYVREHRLVMEELLGRYLTEEEVVHHYDEIKDNNKPENLKLFPSNEKHLTYHKDKEKMLSNQSKGL